MGIVKGEDVLGWEVEGKLFCVDCKEDDGEMKPLTKDDFDDEDYILCDECGKRIQ
jgi:hypothetical protein